MSTDGMSWRADPPNEGREALEPERQRNAERTEKSLRDRIQKAHPNEQ